MDNKTHYVYSLLCPIDNVVRYVGYTQHLEDRYKSHLINSKDTPEDKMQWVLKLRSLGLKPILITLKKSGSQKNTLLSEKFYIDKYLDTIFNVKKPKRKNPKSFSLINEQIYLSFMDKCKTNKKSMDKVLQELMINYNNS